MHPGQVNMSPQVVAALVAEQFPRWRDLEVRSVLSHGTVNALYRLGDDITLRFPLRPTAESWMREHLDSLRDHTQRISAHVPVSIPEQLAIGEPGAGYAGLWSAQRWIPGEPVHAHSIIDFDVFARELGGFISALRSVDTAGRTWDGVSRGGALSTLDEKVRVSLAASTHLTDTDQLIIQWQECLEAPTWQSEDVWIHADLMPGNLLVRDGMLTAVIDWEMAGVGDPAVDLMPAWNLLPAEARSTFRRTVDVDEATWTRGRGWALAQAIIALPYYVTTNPVMADTARHTIGALVG
ncbi:MAG: aminoglycoside phosphotransferase family protein [Longispora sp.]|nr:aminoglycoside phosphotransferase family protein [Longispora sp. (in: high G+C Gram-positive bacteria)]